MVHTHEANLKPGEALVVVRKSCTRKAYRFGPRYRERELCERRQIGCSEVLSVRGAEEFLVRLPARLPGKVDLEFRRPQSPEECLAE